MNEVNITWSQHTLPITHHKTKQISWVPVYFIFVQQNLVQAIPGLSHLSREALILLQLLVYIPLSLLRHIKVSGGRSRRRPGTACSA